MDNNRFLEEMRKENLPMILLKIWINKALIMIFMFNLMKIIKIELSHERSQILMFEKLRQYLLTEFISIFDNERFSVSRPSDAFDSVVL